MNITNALALATILPALLAACGQQEPSAGANTPAPAPVAKVDPGMLRIATEPGDAQIFINGQRKGNSPSEAGQSFAIQLGEGAYQVDAVKPDSGPDELYGQKSDVFVANNSLQTITLKLEKRKSASFRAELQKKYGGKAIEPQLASIPAGSFQMGCVEDKDCSDSEKPVHTVQVAPFQMGKHEVTFDAWDACVADGGCTDWPDDQGWGRGQRPVINVSWDDIQTYLSWLNQKAGKAYRLPSEAEWEYAARAGTPLFLQPPRREGVWL